MLYLTLGMLVLDSHQKKSEAQDLCKETVKIASTALAVLSFGEKILGKENEMWPPPDELPEFRKQRWSIVWSRH